MIGHYFLENDDGTTVTVNSKRYDHMITDFFFATNEKYDLKNILFQQDRVTYHTTRANMASLQQTFPGRVIFCRGDINFTEIHRIMTSRLYVFGNGCNVNRGITVNSNNFK